MTDEWFLRIIAKFGLDTPASVRRYITIMFLVGLLSFPSTLSAPAHQDSVALDIWWFNSCDHNVRLRHDHIPPNCTKISTGINTPQAVKTIVKNQMKSFKSFIRKEFTNMRKNYATVKNANLHDLRLGWLPGPMTMEIFRADFKTKQMLPTFHENLQKYAVAFYYLEKLDITSEAKFNREKRKRIMRNFSTQMKTVLCEIETAVNLTCQSLPVRIPLTDPETIGLTKQSDLTQMYILDWNVVNKFKKFYDSWTKFIIKSFQGEFDEDATVDYSSMFVLEDDEH